MALVKALYWNCPAEHPDMFTDVVLPATSVPSAALTNLTVCVPEFPSRQIRPIADTLRAAGPTVIFMPTQPVKSFRSVPPVADITNGVPVRDPEFPLPLVLVMV